MLSGRLELRRGITVVIGCFVLFGAASIATMLTSLASGDKRPDRVTAQPPVPIPSEVRSATRPVTIYDPYAGASVPAAR